MSMINASLKPDQTSEYLVWKSAVEQNGGLFEWNSLFITNNFVKQLRVRSYYTKIKYLLPVMGKGINACVVPLINTLKTGNATNTSLVNTDFSQSIQVIGDGSTKRLGSGVGPSLLGSNANGGAGFWVTFVASVGSWAIAAYSSAGQIYGMDFGVSNARFWWGDASSIAGTGAAATTGHYYGQRINATDRRLYLNGSQVANNTANSTVSNITDAITIDILALGNYSATSNNGCGLAYLTDGTFTTDEISDFHVLLSQYLMSPSKKI